MEIQDKELHRITATCAIHKDSKYLIIKRALHKKVMPGKWALPGGGLSVDDYMHTTPSTDAMQWYGPMEKALRREVKEEVNLEIHKPEFVRDLAFIRPDGIPVLCFSYGAEYASGEVVLDEDATEFAWVTLKEAEEYDLISGVLDEMRDADRVLQERKG